MLYDVIDHDGIWAAEFRIGGRWWKYLDAASEALGRNIASGVMDEDGHSVQGALGCIHGQARFIVHHLAHPECTCRAKGA